MREELSDIWKGKATAMNRVCYAWKGGSFMISNGSPGPLLADVPSGLLTRRLGSSNWIPMISAPRHTRLQLWRRVVIQSLFLLPHRPPRYGQRSWFDAVKLNLSTARNTLVVSRELHVRLQVNTRLIYVYKH